MSLHRWAPRLVGGLVVFAVLEVVLELTRFDPDPVRLALLVATCTAALGLVTDALSDEVPSWDVYVEQPSVRESGDPRLTTYVNLIESHLTARTPGSALRDRLGVLAGQVLRERYGVPRDDPAAAELMGPELAAVLDGPVRRLDRAEIDRCLTRIEEL